MNPSRARGPVRLPRAGAPRLGRVRIVPSMLAIALALHLTLAAPPPSLVPQLSPPVRMDPGPFQASELLASGVGVLGGDLLVVGAGYATLQLFASGAITPNAANFRTAALGLAAAALVIPPLTGALLGRWARSGPASGSFWKAFLLAATGQALALGAGYFAAPHTWVAVPVQMVGVAAGTSLGLHWGPRPQQRAPLPSLAPRPSPAGNGATASVDGPETALRAVPVCPVG